MAGPPSDDLGHPAGHLTKQELGRPSQRLVRVKERIGGEHPVLRPVSPHRVVGESLGDPVRVERPDRDLFVLGRTIGLREELARSRLQNPAVRHGAPHRFEQAHHSEACVLGRKNRLRPRGRHEALRTEVEDAIGANLLENRQQRIFVEQVARDRLVRECLVARAPPPKGRLPDQTPDLSPRFASLSAT